MDNDALKEQLKNDPVAEPSETEGEASPPPAVPPADKPTDAPQPPKPAQPRSSRKKVRIAIVVVIVLLVAAAVGYWYFVMRKSATPTPVNTSQSTTTVPDTKPFTPSRIIYTQAKGDGNVLASIPFQGGQTTTSNIENIYQVSTHENLVAASTATSVNGQDTVKLFLSTDSGQTFTEVFKQVTATSNAGLAPAITSEVISSDGNQIIFALLTSTNSNTVKSYDIASKTTTNLFTVNSPGVFLEGYNAATQQAYYFTGCYYCDGVLRNVLYVYDVKAKNQSEIYNEPKKAGVSFEFNQEMTKAVVVQGALGDTAIGAGAPYTVRQLDVKAKTFTDITTSNTVVFPQAGYTSDYSSIYYADGNNVYSVDSSGKKVLAFQAEQAIYQVLYVGTDYVIAAVSGPLGGGVPEKVSTINFDVGANKASTVLTTTSDQTLLGLSLTNQ